MAQENNTMTLSSLRNDRTFATISQFFHTFQSAYRPWPNYTDNQWASLLHHPPSINIKSDAAQDDYVFSTEDLEDMLMDTSRRYQLEELFVRMLRLLTRNRFVSVSTWQEYFSREWDRREPDQVNPFHHVNNSPSSPQLTADTTITNDQSSVTQNESMATQSNTKIRSFFDLPMDTRLVLLNTLCEWQLDEPERLREHLNNEEDATQWRVVPIGYDTKGNTFWLFDDNRLYKEAAPLSKKKAIHRKKKKSLSPSTRRNIRRSTRITSIPDENLEEDDDDNEEEWMPWKLVCMTVDEWQRFPQKYSKSQHAQDQQFHQLLVDDVLPKVIPVIEDHEKERKKQEAILYRKRSSRILVRELEALEQHAAEANSELSQRTSSLSRSEQRRLQKEAEEKERQAKAREERILERERKLFAKAQAEERAAEKARLDRERRLQRRHGGGGDNMNGEQDIMMAQHASSQQEQQQQGFKLILTVGDPKKPSAAAKEKVKKKKGINDPMLGKRKRGRKPKVRLEEEDEETWTFNCTCGVFGKNIDDGTPMIACEQCDEWQHIDCLRKSGQVDTQLTSFDDLTFICRRCTEREAKEEIDVDDTNTNTIDERMINTTIQKAMPTPPDISYAATTNNASMQPADYQHHSSSYPPIVQSSERHFLHQQQQQQQQPIKTSYTPPPLKPVYSSSSSQLPYAVLNGISQPSSFHSATISSSHHQTPLPPISRSLGELQHNYLHHQYENRHQQQQQYYQQQQQQRMLPSLPQHLELDPSQTSILSSSSSPFPSATSTNTIALPPVEPSMVTSGNTEETHGTMSPH